MHLKNVIVKNYFKRDLSLFFLCKIKDLFLGLFTEISYQSSLSIGQNVKKIICCIRSWIIPRCAVMYRISIIMYTIFCCRSKGRGNSLCHLDLYYLIDMWLRFLFLRLMNRKEHFDLLKLPFLSPMLVPAHLKLRIHIH